MFARVIEGGRSRAVGNFIFHMTLIEISTDKFINIDSICSVKVSTHTRSKTEDVGYGQTRTRKVGETFTMKIWTADGVEHSIGGAFSHDVYDALFPIKSE